MKSRAISISILLSIIFVFTCHRQKDDFPILKGPYLGQTPPGMTPKIFAPGIVSTEKVELNAVFSKDGKLFYFTRKNDDGLYQIFEMKMEDNQWSAPHAAPFSGIYEQADPFITSDGKYLFYISKKPEKKYGPPPHDIWIMKWEGSYWSEPYNPGPPLNTEHNEIYPTLSLNKTMYFNSNKPGGLGKRDIYFCYWIDGKFTEPVNVGAPISSEYNEGDVLIAPDESFVIFVSADRPGGFGSGDLYISFRTGKGGWSDPINMGEGINSESYDYCPIITHDGKYFFFCKHNDIYWVDAKIIEEFKTIELKVV